MRILTLTDSVAEKILSARRRSAADAERVAAGIIADVRRRGDAALFDWTRRLDGVRLTPKTLWLTRGDARGAISRELRAALEHAARNIRRVAEQQRPRSWTFTVEPGVRVAQRVTPIETIGCYVPGGRFSLVSTLLMTAIPAQVAGVKRIVVACPRPNAAVLAAAEMLGIEEIAHIGGAQAIAALAYGTRSVPRVDKIFGPGNRYVTAAKRLVSADCAMDMLAGPTEVLVLATRGQARFIAADLIAQSEHDPDAVALLVTTSRPLAAAVQRSGRRATELAAAGESGAPLPFGQRRHPDRAQCAERGALRQPLRARASERARWRGGACAASSCRGKRLHRPVGRAVGGRLCQRHQPRASHRWRRALPRRAFDLGLRALHQRADSFRSAGLRRLAPTVSALADAEGLVAHRRDVEVRK